MQSQAASHIKSIETMLHASIFRAPLQLGAAGKTQKINHPVNRRTTPLAVIVNQRRELFQETAARLGPDSVS